uniref:Putative UBP1-associated protein 2A-like n=1 Tax=Davidia involucrata TaxID=16924 RepID=A0A5B6ZZZ6_DAVIN
MASCQLASAGPVPNHPVPDSTGRKIYVANVGPQVNPDKLRSFFAKFGEIEEGPLGHDPVTGKLKGFAIFVYKTAEGCKKALEEPIKVFEGCQLQCRRAVEGHRTNKNQTGLLGASGAAAIHQADINTLNYGVGVNPGMLSHNVNPAAVLVGQNPGMGLANPMMASVFNQTALAPSVAPGLSPSIGATPSLGFSGNYGINNINPSMIGSYGSKAALQGLGAYQNQSAQLGYSSAGATAAAATRPQSGFGFMGTTFPSYFGR